MKKAEVLCKEGMDIMPGRRVSKIKLNQTKKVEEFVMAADKCNFEIDIFYDHIIVDAKSILGILSMDLSRELSVKCYGDDKDFNNILEKFAVA